MISGIYPLEGLGKKPQSKTDSESQALSKSTSFARVPITEYEEFQELTAGPQLHTVEALKEYGKAGVYNLPKRHLVIKKGRQASFTIKTPDNQRVQLHPQLEQAGIEQIHKQCARSGLQIEAAIKADYKAYGTAIEGPPQPKRKPKPTSKLRLWTKLSKTNHENTM